MERKDIRRLAAWADLDERTVERALVVGLDGMRSKKDREALQQAAKDLGIKLPKPGKGNAS